MRTMMKKRRLSLRKDKTRRLPPSLHASLSEDGERGQREQRIVKEECHLNKEVVVVVVVRWFVSQTKIAANNFEIQRRTFRCGRERREDRERERERE